MAEIRDLSVTDASNNGSAANAGAAEGMAPSEVNNSMRALRGLLKRGFNDAVEGDKDSTGSSNAYAVAANRTIAAYYDGMRIGFHANHANTGAATLNVDAVGAKDIKKNHDVALASGDIEQHQYVEVVYSASDDAFQMISPVGNSSAGYTDPLTTRGDIVKRGASATERLAIGSANTVLTTDGTDPAWSTVATAMIADDAVSSAKIADDAVVQAAIADEAVNEARLQVSNAPTNGYFLSAQSGNTGGLTWAEVSGGAWTLIGTQDASSSASLTQTGLDSSTYDSIAVIFSAMHPATDDVIPQIQLGDSGGIDSGGSDYSWNVSTVGQAASSSVANVGSTGDSSIGGTSQTSGTDKVGNAAGEGWSANVILDIGSSDMYPNLYGTLAYRTAQPHSRYGTFSGTRLSQITCDRILFKFSSGSITSGRMSVFGIKHS
tara:strand:+ start:345 stop:1646 length:1302 start_codon:yes stop_codon:yes gene_type:complete